MKVGLTLFITISFVIMFGLGLLVLLYGLKLKKAPESKAATSDWESDPIKNMMDNLPAARIAMLVGGLSILISLAILAGGVFTTVSAKNAGVLVAFGKVSEKTLSPGLHTKMPWEKVVEIDGTIKTDIYEYDNCIYVRIGDGSQACLTVTNRWNIREDAADQLYQDHKSDDPTADFRKEVVNPSLEASLQKALSDYNPVAQFQGADKSATSADLSFSPDYDAVSRIVEEDMKTRLAGKNLAEVQSITISFMQISDNTQKKLDDYVAAIGDTRIAEQKKQTATAQAEANNTLSSSVSKDPNVLVSRCLDTLADSVEKGYQLPAGFSCWPGGGGGVVIPGANAGQ